MQDMSAKEPEFSDEIDLLELFATIWAGKFVIALFVVGSIALGSLYLHRADRKYTVSLTVSQVGEEQSGPNLAGLGGLASLAGVSLPSGGSGDFSKFKAMIKAEELASTVLKYDTYLTVIFASEWDEEAGNFAAKAPSQLGELKQQVKFILTGEKPMDYRAPDAARLAAYIGQSVSISEDKDTGFLALKMEVVESDFAKQFLQTIVYETDKMLKEQYVASGTQALQFYQEKIARARSQEHREALAKMIASEEQKQMLASRDGPFVAEVVMGPSVSLEPTSPKSSLILALSLVLGAFLGIAYVLVKKALTNKGDARA